MSRDYRNEILDVRPDRLDLRDRPYLPRLKSLPNRFPDEEIISALLPHYAENLNLILDQGREGACTGFGLAAVINYLEWRDLNITDENIRKIQNGEDPEYQNFKKVSERMLYHNARIYDEWDGEDYEGSSCRGAMKGWHRHGVCSEEFWPYRKNGHVEFVTPKPGWAASAGRTPLGAYYRIDKNSVVDMQSAIYEVGAIYCSSYVHDGWFVPRRDVLQHSDVGGTSLPSITQGTPHRVNRGGHAFAIVGYTPDGFIIQNSWGVDWGHLGFAILEYKDWVEFGADAWVAVRGAVTKPDVESPETFVPSGGQFGTAQRNCKSQRHLKAAENFVYENEEVKPWSTREAYLHSVVLGNNGRPLQRITTNENADSSIATLGKDRPKDWMKKTGNKKLIVFAHGGLNNECDSIRRIQILGPYFKANGIYPIFITWKTGIWESLLYWLKDETNTLFGGDTADDRFTGFGDFFRDIADRSLEFASRKMGTAIWREMKENARYASDRQLPGSPNAKGGMVVLADELTKLSKDTDLEIHIAGHSAGAILLGHWLRVLQRKKLTVATCTLLAPACTMEHANQFYKHAVEKGVLSKKGMHFDILSDERERADNAGPYGKSLLYLVSRAFEDMHKMPLLGMEAVWEKALHEKVWHDKKKSDETAARMAEIDSWNKFWGKSKGLQIHGDINIATSRKKHIGRLSHGSFDNDLGVIEAMLARISGKRPKFPVEFLSQD